MEDDKKKKEMKKNVDAYNRMYGSFLESMDSVQKFFLGFSIIVIILLVLYFIFR